MGRGAPERGQALLVSALADDSLSGKSPFKHSPLLTGRVLGFYQMEQSTQASFTYPASKYGFNAPSFDYENGYSASRVSTQ